MNPLTAAILAVLIAAVGFGPRRWALLALMGGVFFLTQAQAVDIAGLNLYPLRFLEVAAFVRVLARREGAAVRWSGLDWAVVLLYNYAAFVWIVRASDFTPYQLAAALDPTLCYIALRALIRDVDDVRWFLAAFVWLLLPFTLLVLSERITGQSAFRVVGATYGLTFRDGVPRCMGTFRHAILLGSVAASFLALYSVLAIGGPQRRSAVCGAALCLALVVLSNSGGPLTSMGAAFLGWLVWPLRERMRAVRWATLGLLLLLIAFMKAPIWYLPFKVSAVVGGGGFHRGLLMDQAWQDLGKWWLAGMRIEETADWFAYIHPDLGGADITNQFVAFGIRAGLPAIGLCVVLLVLAFRGVGTSLAALRARTDGGRADGLLVWGLGVAVFVHAVSWLGVSYFDQSWAVWLMHIAALSASARAPQPDVARAGASASAHEHQPTRGRGRSGPRWSAAGSSRGRGRGLEPSTPDRASGSQGA